MSSIRDRWIATAFVLTAMGCACEGPCVQPAAQSVFTHTLTPAERALFPAGDGSYYGTTACSRVCDPPSSDGGTDDASAHDAGVALFNRVNCSVRGSDIECRFQFVCGG